MSSLWIGRVCAFLLFFCSFPLYAFDWCGHIRYQPGKLKSVYMFVDGRFRHYSLYVSPNYQPSAPLLLDFHGLGSTKYSQYRTSCWRDTADRYGLVVAYPQAIGVVPTWNGGDFCCYPRSDNDMKFALKIVQCLTDEAQTDLRFDQQRIYSVGLSNGGSFAGRLACEQSDVFSGAQIVSQSFPFSDDEQCRLIESNGAVKPAFPVVEVRGQYDVIVPHDFSWSWSLPSNRSRQKWKAAQGCSGEPRSMDVCDRPGSGPSCEYGRTQCQVYDDCDGGVTVTHCSLQDGHLLYDNDHHYNACEDALFEFERFK